MENRHGLAVGTCLTTATGTAERYNAVLLAAGAPYPRGAHHGGGRQGLRYHGVRRRIARGGEYAARGAQRYRTAPECDRWADDAPSGLRGEPAQTQTDRGDLWLAQDRGRLSADAPPGARPCRLDGDLCHRGLQPGADADHPGAHARLTMRAPTTDARRPPRGRLTEALSSYRNSSNFPCRPARRFNFHIISAAC